MCELDNDNVSFKCACPIYIPAQSACNGGTYSKKFS